MKRQSKAEEALNRQLEQIKLACKESYERIAGEKIKADTLNAVRIQLESEIDRLKGVRIRASEQNKPK